ncbi:MULTISPECIES: hypothetical protein [Oenococcus]|uniref:Uncharacterized protein n=1 Tax=Oenococcus kitaharae DSM 17330 TaxID=1045004 RepID=G9WJ63_9LACO|nr:hypothetical protein [Oenococcus kitaharae]EHN58512.1 hypothetical protein OKIT_0391 [Oenococcus kitaharae DSM 17330]OEY81338.1 hypothetical protein NT95_07400 [Oenococcus kitaharae]OEY82826.1 hypothetical protein NV75_05500 [Oenococcus kitaharae]OEY84630.1 hypothetical protein NT96_05135 [Oenococcus kitaharae]
MIENEAWDLLDRASSYSTRLEKMIGSLKLDELSSKQAIIRLSVIFSLSQAVRDDIKAFKDVTKIERE